MSPYFRSLRLWCQYWWWHQWLHCSYTRGSVYHQTPYTLDTDTWLLIRDFNRGEGDSGRREGCGSWTSYVIGGHTQLLQFARVKVNYLFFHSVTGQRLGNCAIILKGITTAWGSRLTSVVCFPSASISALLSARLARSEDSNSFRALSWDIAFRMLAKHGCRQT